jgi:hypothetical protein
MIVINPCSNSTADWQSDLSPFLIGPCNLYNGLTALNMENAWQYAKVYKDHVDPVTGWPTPEYHIWAKEGWANPRAVRYPRGRGAKPEYSFWDGQKYGYIDARKKIYGPLYAKAVLKRPGWQRLKDVYENHSGTMVIRDFDGYDHIALNMSLNDVVHLSRRKMGHAFVLAMLLLKDKALLNFE